MKKSFVLLALAFLSCCQHDNLRIGGKSPIHTQEILDVAQNHGCDLKGDLVWVDHIEGHPNYAGYCGWDSCGFYMQVVRKDDSLATALGHELGHWCLKTNDENRAEAYGLMLYTEVLDELWKNS